jgi:hypothetical protein
MSILSLIEAFNDAFNPQIETLPTRDGRVRAKLPRVGREILVQGSQFNVDVKVTPSDLALLCEEVRRAMAPGVALMDESLNALYPAGVGYAIGQLTPLPTKRTSHRASQSKDHYDYR